MLVNSCSERAIKSLPFTVGEVVVQKLVDLVSCLADLSNAGEAKSGPTVVIYSQGRAFSGCSVA